MEPAPRAATGRRRFHPWPEGSRGLAHFRSTAAGPTAAMLAGDFSVAMAPACRATGQLNLSPTLGFAGNRIDPSRLNPIAVNFARTYLPVGQADPCGLVSYQGHVPGNNPTE